MENNEKQEPIFADGFFFDRPREGAPDFVKGRMSIMAEKAIAFITKHKNEAGYVNLDFLKSKDGKKLYFQLNTWKPDMSDKPEGLKDNQVEDPAF